MRPDHSACGMAAMCEDRSSMASTATGWRCNKHSRYSRWPGQRPSSARNNSIEGSAETSVRSASAAHTLCELGTPSSADGAGRDPAARRNKQTDPQSRAALIASTPPRPSSSPSASHSEPSTSTSKRASSAHRRWSVAMTAASLMPASCHTSDIDPRVVPAPAMNRAASAVRFARAGCRRAPSNSSVAAARASGSSSRDTRQRRSCSIGK